MIRFLILAVRAGFGLAAIAAAIFWSVHVEFIQADMFSEMTAQQKLSAFKWSSGLAAGLFLIAIIFSGPAKPPGKVITADNGGVAVDNSGFFNSFKSSKNKSDGQ